MMIMLWFWLRIVIRKRESSRKWLRRNNGRKWQFCVKDSRRLRFKRAKNEYKHCINTYPNHRYSLFSNWLIYIWFSFWSCILCYKDSITLTKSFFSWESDCWVCFRYFLSLSLCAYSFYISSKNIWF